MSKRRPKKLSALAKARAELLKLTNRNTDLLLTITRRSDELIALRNALVLIGEAMLGERLDQAVIDLGYEIDSAKRGV